MANQKVQEKTNTLETYTKSAGAKASEKDVKAHKEKISDQNLEIKALRTKAAEWQFKVLENEANLNAKEKENDQRVGENNRKMTALKSEVESEHKCLEENNDNNNKAFKSQTSWGRLELKPSRSNQGSSTSALRRNKQK
ncbi:kinetochore protein NUF2 homolog isoform X2 [Miscanthus floridulus]|uniref:kinetochore protein NUF2 homolog isoform X2 n=1 Tax=Miscanthus floridulus TaxID=154761 RepID=UPI00345AC33B